MQQICRDRGWLLIWNSSSETELLKSFAQTNQVITNSFHGSYWGLLSDRPVKVIAHNMKFISLFEGMGLEGSSLVHVYEKRDGDGLIENLRCTQMEDFVSLKNARSMRSDFQSRNLEFAKKLIDCGLFEDVVPAVKINKRHKLRLAQFVYKFLAPRRRHMARTFPYLSAFNSARGWKIR